MDIFAKYDSTEILPVIDEVVVEVTKNQNNDRATVHVIPDDKKGYEQRQSKNQSKWTEY